MRKWTSLAVDWVADQIVTEESHIRDILGVRRRSSNMQQNQQQDNQQQQQTDQQTTNATDDSSQPTSTAAHDVTESRDGDVIAAGRQSAAGLGAEVQQLHFNDWQCDHDNRSWYKWCNNTVS